jgi:hypothetical protein
LMVWYTDRELGELYFYIFKIRKQVWRAEKIITLT